MSNYVIKIPHFYSLEYYEDNRKLLVDIDFREPQIFLSKDMIRNWEYPNEKEIISDMEKIRIINNIYSYLLKNNSKERIRMEKR